MIDFGSPFEPPLKIHITENGWIIEVPPPPLPPPLSLEEQIRMQSQMYADVARSIKKDDALENLGMAVENDVDISELTQQKPVKQKKNIYVFNDFDKMMEFLLPFLKNSVQ